MHTALLNVFIFVLSSCNSVSLFVYNASIQWSQEPMKVNEIFPFQLSIFVIASVVAVSAALIVVIYMMFEVLSLPRHILLAPSKMSSYSHCCFWFCFVFSWMLNQQLSHLHSISPHQLHFNSFVHWKPNVCKKYVAY